MGITLSSKYGVNPTMPICFWCGEEKNEIALMGQIGDSGKHEDFEAPHNMVINYEPCDKCRSAMDKGFTIIEATTAPNNATSIAFQTGAYPTGRFVVLTKEAAARLFDGFDEERDKAFLDIESFEQMFCHDLYLQPVILYSRLHF